MMMYVVLLSKICESVTLRNISKYFYTNDFSDLIDKSTSQG